MGDFEERFSANLEQAEYWNSVAGQKWAKYDAEMDSRLRPMTYLNDTRYSSIGRSSHPSKFVEADQTELNATHSA